VEGKPIDDAAQDESSEGRRRTPGQCVRYLREGDGAPSLQRSQRNSSPRLDTACDHASLHERVQEVSFATVGVQHVTSGRGTDDVRRHRVDPVP
jgi:hypothetical protein